MGRAATVEFGGRDETGCELHLRLFSNLQRIIHLDAEYPHTLIGPKQIDESADRPIRVPDPADERLPNSMSLMVEPVAGEKVTRRHAKAW
jgi:hypothetical protein